MQLTKRLCPAPKPKPKTSL